jgi:DNA-binding CsgD family transcriptional regulator
MLTKKETEIMGLVRQGRRKSEIAKELHIAYCTVATHFMHIKDKLGAFTMAHAVWLYANQQDDAVFKNHLKHDRQN